MTPAIIRPLTDSDRKAWLGLRQALWMGSDVTTLAAEAGTLLSEPQHFGALVYGVLLAVEGEHAIGFVEVSLRDDVEEFGGRPVGYVEGVYVEPRHQRRGLGRALIEAAAAWARAQGASALASDVVPGNLASITFHQRVGFSIIGETGEDQQRQVLLTRPVPPA
jgi:aminoglycoside 6'-N-acetyltransferase I